MRKVINIKPAIDPVTDEGGKWIVRADSRPPNYDVCFIGAGDDLQNSSIGTGQELRWDFENDENSDPNPPEGFQRKLVNFQLLDGAYLKEGTAYFFNAPKGSHIDMYILCPPGGYYQKKTPIQNADGSVTVNVEFLQATELTVVEHPVIKFFIEGSCPMGDELNTEAASYVMSPYYLIWQIMVTTPDVTGNNWQAFHGHFNLELYRPRSLVF